MLPKDHKIFIDNAKKEYKKIGFVECPAFSGEGIYFNTKGFTHLLRKGIELRPINIQVERIRLIKYAPFILEKAKMYDSYRKDIGKFKKIDNIKDSIIQFWSFKKMIDDKNIVVVVCQINNGNKYFLSIMEKM